MATLTTTPAAHQRSPGRACFWAGIAVCLLGLGAVVVQFGLKYLFVPWYSPVLATLGAFLLVVAVVRRRSIPRVLALVLVAAFAGLQWYFLGVVLKLPAYEGPARVGQPIPAFRTTLANGKPFSDEHLRDGSWRVLVFFRGRW